MLFNDGSDRDLGDHSRARLYTPDYYLYTRPAMVKFSEESPFLQDDDSGQPSAVCSQHVRSLELLKTIVQVGPPHR